MAKKKIAKKKAKKAAPPRKVKKAAKKTLKKVVKKAAKAKTKPAAKKRVKRRQRGRADAGELVTYQERGLGAFTGGQSGDTQGISGRGGADSESVEELLEEGQTFEAEAVKGVEDAPDADEGEVRTHQFPEDDVPEEYQDKEPG